MSGTKMKTSRLEAFSDGVLAIIITIMVLELNVPHTVELSALKPLLPVLLSYVLSFIYLGIYWNNHHHLFQATDQFCGQTFIYCSGCRSFLSPQAGWVRMVFPPLRRPCTGSFY